MIDNFGTHIDNRLTSGTQGFGTKRDIHDPRDLRTHQQEHTETLPAAAAGRTRRAK